MISVLTNYQKFSVTEIKDQNILIGPRCDKYIEQNDKDAIISFLNSLNDELHQDIWARIEPDMLFTKVFLIFIQHERPQNRETYNLLEQKLINFDNTLSNYTGSNIKEICGDMCKIIKGWF